MFKTNSDLIIELCATIGERDALSQRVADLELALMELLEDSIERHHARCAEYNYAFFLTGPELHATKVLSPAEDPMEEGLPNV